MIYIDEETKRKRDQIFKKAQETATSAYDKAMLELYGATMERFSDELKVPEKKYFKHGIVPAFGPDSGVANNGPFLVGHFVLVAMYDEEEIPFWEFRLYLKEAVHITLQEGMGAGWDNFGDLEKKFVGNLNYILQKALDLPLKGDAAAEELKKYIQIRYVSSDLSWKGQEVVF